MESQRQASHASHEPLGNLAKKDGEIPTFPQLRRRRRMEKWKTKSRFSHFPTAAISLSQKNKTVPRAGFALRPRWRFAPLSGPLLLRRRGKLSLRP